jgi:hypothetical protein
MVFPRRRERKLDGQREKNKFELVNISGDKQTRARIYSIRWFSLCNLVNSQNRQVRIYFKEKNRAKSLILFSVKG